MSTEPEQPFSEAERLAKLNELHDKLKALEAAVVERDPSRRALIAGVVGAGIGVAAMSAAKPSEAFADINLRELIQGVTEGIEDTSLPGDLALNLAETILIREIMSVAFSVLGALGIPPQFMMLIRCVLGAPGGLGFNFNACAALGDLINGPNSMMRTDRIPQTMETIWHPEPEEAAVDMDAMTVANFHAMFDQVQGSQMSTAALAEGQDALGMADDIALAELNAAAASGSLITAIAKLGQLQYSGNRISSMVLESLNASQQTRGAHMLADHHRRYLDSLDRVMKRSPTEVPIPGAQPTVSGSGGGGFTLFGNGG